MCANPPPERYLHKGRCQLRPRTVSVPQIQIRTLLRKLLEAPLHEQNEEANELLMHPSFSFLKKKKL